MKRVDGKIALITGAGRGLGRETAGLLAQQGARVIITDIDLKSAEAAATEIGGNARALQQNVAEEGEWTRLIDNIRANEGRLDILVNNAAVGGLSGPRDPESMTLDDWNKTLLVNGTGVFLGCRSAIPLMRDSGGGSIINMSSIAALAATPMVTAYGASKALVAQLTQSVAVYCGQKGYNIRCNSIHPGLIMTPMLQDIVAREAEIGGVGFGDSEEAFRSMVPLQKMQEPRDIADAILFLASDESRYITGQKIVIDGGLSVRL